MATPPRKLDLKAKTAEELTNLLRNAERLGRADIVDDVNRERASRGPVRKPRLGSAQFDALEWSQKSAAEALTRFREIALTVPGNRRTSYTEAGGRRMQRRDSPDHLWVDSYSAIKTPRINAAFNCSIAKPGDPASFQLTVNDAVEARYAPDELDRALTRWQEIAVTART